MLKMLVLMCIVGLTYVSFTSLNDNTNRTICNGTHWGARSTQVCDDGEVYDLNLINRLMTSPSSEAPPGFDTLLDYGIVRNFKFYAPFF